MRPRLALVTILLLLPATFLPWGSKIPSLEQNVLFPPSTFVIPMDEKQADRVAVFGFVHSLLDTPNPAQVFRVLQPPDVLLSTDLTPSPSLFRGGPFLLHSESSSKVLSVAARHEFENVTIGTLIGEHTLGDIVSLTDAPRVLVIKGQPSWGRTDLTLDAMKIPYTLVTREQITAAPDLLSSHSVIIVDCPGWFGFFPSQLAAALRDHVAAGSEVIFTEIAMKDLVAIFPGYVALSDAQPQARREAYAYNPARIYDRAEYGVSAARFEADFASQHFDPESPSGEIRVFTESGGYVVLGVWSDRVNDVRILIDSTGFESHPEEYAILSFYFTYEQGIVAGLAFHPQQQQSSVIGSDSEEVLKQMLGSVLFQASVERESGTVTSTTAATSSSGLIAGHVVVNEVEQNPPGDDSDKEWIELYNPTGWAAAVGGWVIYTTEGEVGGYVIPEGTTIPARGFLVLILPGAFIDDQGDSVVLLDLQGIQVDVTPALSDTGDDTSSWQRYPDGSSQWLFGPGTSTAYNVAEFEGPLLILFITLCASLVAIHLTRKERAPHKAGCSSQLLG